MKKVAILFVLAVLAPSVLLALLAGRTLTDQRFVLERQQTLLYQTVTDSFAQEINDLLAEEQRYFAAVVEKLIISPTPRATAGQFDDQIRQMWPMAEVGFAVTLNGTLLCPSPTAGPEARLFCQDNAGFLGNRESAEVYLTDHSLKGYTTSPTNESTYLKSDSTNLGGTKLFPRKVNPVKQPTPAEPVSADPNVSKVVSTEAEFRQLIGDGSDGMVARFLQNKLRLMFWHRLERDPQLVFGVQLDLNRVATRLREIIATKPLEAPLYVTDPGKGDVWEKSPARQSVNHEIRIALLDENARPIAVSNTNSTSNWKQPFVATEIGEALPHWEVAAYLMNPDAIRHAANTMRLTVSLLIAVLLIAMVVGSWLIVNDLNRQVTLARQKTDFVSNVSHELKTPLTSIRMFAELLAENRVAEPEKQKSYLNIITSEAARLTRLINNVLDFSRLERGEKKYNLAELDLVALVNETVATYRPHLESHGFHLESNVPPAPVPVRGDRDALSQIIVNLISNAEKYSNGQKDVRVELLAKAGNPAVVEVCVLDRGPGVPRGLEERIFEQFYRVPDSLSSGVEGSGLGLTLARQIARAHGGDVVYSAREAGGSCFTLRLPLGGC